MKVHGLSGLANLGNTCYINTCMQILSHTPCLNTLLDTIDYNHIKHKKNILDTTLITEWNNLRILLWKTNCVVSPNRWINTIQQIAKQKDLELFSGFLQNDITEFIFFILNSFHEALSKEVNMQVAGNIKTNTDILANKCLKAHADFFESNYSTIIKDFYGMEINIIQDAITNITLTQSYTPFSLLTLALTNSRTPSLFELFEHHHIIEELGDDNLWKNEQGELVSIKKTIKIWNYPNILIIFLKRWNPVNNRKDQRIVHYPLNDLNLSKFVIGYNPNTYIYDLYGVCNHSGSNEGGHYSAFIKHQSNNTWYHFNDTSVSKINPDKVISNKAYCLFYNKKNIH